MKKKAMWLILSCLIVLALVLASCGPAAVEEEEGKTVIGKVVEKEEEKEKEEEEEKAVMPTGPQYGGAYTIGTTEGTKTHAVIQGGLGPLATLSFIYERLGKGNWLLGHEGCGYFTWVSEEAQSPGLATSWERTDPVTLVFHLRKGVPFHDIPPINGREMIADDVAASFNLYIEGSATYMPARPYIVSVTATDKYTVEFKLSEKHSEILTFIGWGTATQVHPRELIEAGGDMLEDWKYAIGTGPFIVDDFVAGSSVSFKRNPNYWGVDERHPENQIPYVDSAKILVIPDLSTRLSALRTGKIDKLSGLAREDAVGLDASSPELLKHEYLLQSGWPRIGFKMEHEIFSDIRVRKALSMAIDRDTWIEELLGGKGEPLSYPILAIWEDVYTPREELPEDVREIYEYNPDKARQLLAEAGYPDGFKCEAVLQQNVAELTEIISTYWADIGVDCKIRVLETAAYYGEAYGRKFKDIVITRSSQTSALNILLFFTSGHFYNYAEIYDPYFDEQMEKIIQTFDRTEQNLLLKELNVHFLRQCYIFAGPTPYIYTYWQPWIEGYDGEAGLGAGIEGDIAARIWIDQELKQRRR